MGTVLTEYEGSKAGTSHKIIRGADGVVYCDCWAWKVNKKCKHLDRFFSKFTPLVGRIEVPVPVPLTSNASSAADLIKAIKEEQPTFWTVDGGTNENTQIKQ
jgi:hypothetical protein